MPLTNQADFGRYFGAGFEMCYTVHPSRMEACQRSWFSVLYGINVKGLSITDSTNSAINTVMKTYLDTYYNKNISYLLNNGKATSQVSSNTVSTPISRACVYGSMDDYYAVICRLANIFLNTDSMNRNITGTGPNAGNMRMEDYEMVRKPLIRLYAAAAANKTSPDLSYVINLQDLTELASALAVIQQNYTTSTYNSALYPTNINQDAHTFWTAVLATGTTVEDNTRAYGFSYATSFIQMLCNNNEGLCIGNLSILYSSSYPAQSGTDYQLYRKMLSSIGSSVDDVASATLFGKLNSTISTSNSNKDAINTNITAVSSTLATVNTNVTTASSTIGTVNTNVTALTSSMNTVSSNVTTLTSTVGTSNANITALSSSIGTNASTDNTTVFGTLRLLQSSVNSAITTDNSNKDAINTNITAVSSAVSTSNTKITSLTSTVGTSTSTDTATIFGTLRSLQSTLNTSITTGNSNKDAINSNIAALSSTVGTINSNVTTANSTVGTINTNVTALSSSVGTTTSADNTTVFGSLRLLQSSVNNSITTGNSNKDAINSNIAALSSTVGTINSNVTTINSNLTKANSSITTVTSTLGTSTSTDVATIFGTLRSLQSTVNILIGSVQSSGSNQGVSVNTGSSNVNTDLINANIAVLRSIMGTNNSNDNSTILGALYLLQSDVSMLIGAVQQLANIQGVPVNLGVQGFLSTFNPTSWLLLVVLGIILILQLRIVLK